MIPASRSCGWKGAELARDMECAHLLFVNEYEFGLISKKTGFDLAEMLEHVDVIVITRGRDGSSIYADRQEYAIPVASTLGIVDPTGVGDAYRGGFLSGYARGCDWELCGKIGSLAATYCLEQKGPQNHSFTRLEFVKRFRENFDDQGVLDVYF